MPPNKKGGKNYKKGKHADDEPVIYEKQDGQMYGRVLKLLGGCNAMVYCNDNRERLCHIRGSMRKKVWIETGDIVLISTRDLAGEGDKNIDKGDICAKYDPRVIYRLRQKDSSINELLFSHIEKGENTGNKSGNIPVNDENGFIFESDKNEVNEGESSDSDNGLKPANRAAQKRAMKFDDDDGDINIDDI